MPATGAMFAQNPWNATFGTRVAFADMAGRQTQWTGDRREFLGRHGTLARPAALRGTNTLSQQVGAGLDPCGVLRAPVQLAPGETVEIVFLLGQAADAASARALIEQYRTADLEAVFRQVAAHWDDVLGMLQVKTPDRSMDIILNRWMLYQALACRMWARSAFYQASGAYGFRDQLQDAMALAVSVPAVAREHLLRAAGRQFTQGDVQHWWLPTAGQGVRTRIADDRIWLAHAAQHYVEVDGRCRGARRSRAVHRRPGPATGRARFVFPAVHCRRIGVALRALRARARPEPGRGRARSAIVRHRRLERRHESSGRGRAWREHVARLVPVCDARRIRAAGTGTRRGTATIEMVGARRGAADGARRPGAGTGPGIGAATSTTGRRWDRPRAKNAASIPSPSPGASCPGRRTLTEPPRRWRRWTGS